MKNYLKSLIAPVALSACLMGGVSLPADAQLVVVEDNYRIVDVDRVENRIGIAKPDADPNVRQTWVYLEPDTKASARQYYQGGVFRDQVYSTNPSIIEMAELHEGQVIKLHGGRDFDGSIDAKKIWF